MKKAAKIIYAAIFFGICAVPLAAMPFVKSNAEIEKKELTPMPALVKDGSINTDFSTQFESWFNDRLPFRSQLLSGANLVKGEILTSPSSNVIPGKDGWLFFEGCKADFMNTNAMTELKLRQTAVTLSLIQENVKAKDGRFLFVPMPNKETVYGEYMPDCYIRASGNNLSRLSLYLDEQGVNYLDMTSLMKQNKQQGIYHKRDTHWNYLGALIGYRGIMDAIGKEHKSYEGAAYTLSKDWRADLDKLLYPSGGFMDWQYHFDISWDEFEFAIPAGIDDVKAQLDIFMSDKEENDLRISTVKTEPGDEDSRLYMVRDSFGRALLPFMIDNYDRAMFVRTTSPELSMVAQGADMIYEIVERNLANLTVKAPFMFAPERQGIAASGAGSELTDAVAEDAGYGFRIYGILPDDAYDSTARVYVKLSREGESHIFEAFPIVEKDLLKENVRNGATYKADIDKSENGFSLFVDPKAGLSGSYDIAVIAGGKEYTSAVKAEFKAK